MSSRESVSFLSDFVVSDRHHVAAPEVSQKPEAVSDAQPSEASTPTAPSVTESSPAKGDTRKFDFGFLPIPKYLRHDTSTERPFHFTLALNIFFGLASTLSECNAVSLYQPCYLVD